MKFFPSRITTQLVQFISSFRRRTYGKFIILTRSRTGSTLLAKLLDQHAQVCCNYERFAKLKGRSVEAIWNSVFTLMPRTIAWVGFKIFYYHPLDATEHEAREIWDRLMGDTTITVIHLMRRNKIRIAVSSEIAMKTGEYQKQLGVDRKKITVSKEELRQHIDYTQNAEAEFRQKFCRHHVIELFYEDLVNDPQGELARVFESFGIERIPVNIPSTRQNPERLSELLLNYEELRAEFLNTEWGKYFD